MLHPRQNNIKEKLCITAKTPYTIALFAVPCKKKVIAMKNKRHSEYNKREMTEERKQRIAICGFPMSYENPKIRIVLTGR